MDEEKTMVNFKTKYLDNISQISVSSDMEFGQLLQKLLDTNHLLIYEIERVVLCKGDEQLFSLGDDDHPYSTSISSLKLSGDEQLIVVPANKKDRNNNFIDRFISYEREKDDEKIARDMQQEMYYSDGNGEYGDVYNRLLNRASHQSRPFYFMGSGNSSVVIPQLNAMNELMRDGVIDPATDSPVVPPGTTSDATSTPHTLPPITSQNPFSILGEVFRRGFSESDMQLPGGFSYSFTGSLPDNTTITVEEEIDDIDSNDESDIDIDLDNLPELVNDENENIDGINDIPPPPPETGSGGVSGVSGGSGGSGLTMPNLTVGSTRYSRIMDAVLALSGIGSAPPPSGSFPPARFGGANRMNIFNYLAEARGGNPLGVPRGFADPVKVTLTDDEFNSLESVVFGTIKDETKSRSCAICICDYEDDESVLKLSNCEHLFHKECIGKWLKENSTKCPVCKAVVAEGKPNM